MNAGLSEGMFCDITLILDSCWPYNLKESTILWHFLPTFFQLLFPMKWQIEKDVQGVTQGPIVCVVIM